MGEHLADYVDVGTRAEEQGGVGVAEAVEGDVLLYACIGNPVLQFCLNEAVVEAFEHLALAWSAAEFIGFVSDWKGCASFCLFRGDAKAVATVWVLGDVLPFEVANISEAKSS